MLISQISLFQILDEGAKQFSWNDVHIDDFIQDAIHVVYTENIKVVECIQENYQKICQIIGSWSESTVQFTMMDESHWPYTFEEYDQKQRLVYHFVLN